MTADSEKGDREGWKRASRRKCKA